MIPEVYCIWICEGKVCRAFVYPAIKCLNQIRTHRINRKRFMTWTMCEVWRNIAKTASESRSVLFWTTISTIWLSAHQFSSLATAGTRLASDWALGRDFQSQTVWPSISECHWVFLLLASLLLLLFCSVFPLQGTLADDCCCHAALRGRRVERLRNECGGKRGWEICVSHRFFLAQY